MRKLDEYEYAGPLTLEVGMSAAEKYKKMEPKAFIQDAYNRIKKISEL